MFTRCLIYRSLHAQRRLCQRQILLSTFRELSVAPVLSQLPCVLHNKAVMAATRGSSRGTRVADGGGGGTQGGDSDMTTVQNYGMRFRKRRKADAHSLHACDRSGVGLHHSLRLRTIHLKNVGESDAPPQRLRRGRVVDQIQR